MSKYIPEILRDTLKPAFPSTKRVVFVGTRASGKTTTMGCLALTCGTKSATDPRFKYFIDEKTSGIRQAPSDLRRGRFPEPTPPGLIYEADIVMEWGGTLSNKTITLPFCETAGEDIQKLIGRYSSSMYRPTPTDWQNAETINRYICDSNGYILVIPVSRALMFGGESMESEPSNLLQDPDVNISRILANIIRHKRQTRSPDIEGIAVLLTKYDMIDAFIRERGMNLYDPQGARLFLTTYFSQTSDVLKFFGMNKVRFFPVHVQVERNSKGQFVQWKDGSGFKIIVDYNRNLPYYSEKSYFALIDWIKDTF